MGEPTNIQQAELTRARELIEKIGRKHGYIDKKYWDALPEESRQVFSEAFVGLMGSLEPPIKSLAKSLSSSKANLILELLQNAEDNKFEHAQQPYVSFHLSDAKLVVECNEDGFTEENLHAICDIGKSSKGRNRGFIGEKGIGFKSVFMAAYRVHIQSGAYSFVFEHHPDDTGIGMIRPIWQDPTEELPPRLTRMTLHLHTEGDESHIAMQRESIRQQLLELNGDVLLFMRNLREIRIIVEGETRVSTLFSKVKATQDRTTITKTVEESSKLETSSVEYLLERGQVQDLAKSDNRTYAEEEEEDKAHSTADVILAFPLSSDSMPIIEPQKIFALLPMKHFLIQSDFVINAIREGVVLTAQRNIDLLEGICDTFVQAVTKFCDHPTLQYTWMRYLPDKKNTYGNFWSELVGRIESKIRSLPLIRPDSGGCLRIITELGQPLPQYLDGQDNLLLRDLKPEVRLSRHYTAQDVTVLQEYGLGGFLVDHFISMVEQDLVSSDSWIKLNLSDDYLQANVASILSNILDETNESNRLAIRKLPILPLTDERWVAASDGLKVFFPSIEGVSIPCDLDFNLISPDAAARSESCKLFKNLGVETLDIKRVREAIFSRHQLYRTQRGKKLKYYVNHLEFLFYTHLPEVHPQQQYNDLFVASDSLRQEKPRDVDIYLPCDDPLGPRELLKPIEPQGETDKAGNLPKVDFLHDRYLEVAETPHQKGLNWCDWLVEVIGIRRSLRLATKSSWNPDLSEACYYVAKSRPEKFMTLLYNVWPEESRYFEGDSRLLLKLKNVHVLCQGGHMEPLQYTYLPLPRLISEASGFLGNAKFPFLQLEGFSDNKFDDETWGSLVRHLGIGNKDDIEFFLKILVTRSGDNESDPEFERILTLYNKIYGLYQLQTGAFQPHLRQTIRDHFNEKSLICVPFTPEGVSPWATATECLWEAPSNMTSKHSLKARIQIALSESPTELSGLETLFTKVLEIPNCGWLHILNELRLLSSGETDLDTVHELYSQLDAMLEHLPVGNQKTIKTYFSNHKLIYCEKDGVFWHAKSQCLWSSETDIHGWTILQRCYGDLHDFFVDFLKVKTLDLQLVYDELLYLGSLPKPTVKQVKANIWALNDLLPSSSERPDVSKLLSTNILPVNHPQEGETLCNSETDFVIVDRMHLGSLFKHKVPTLSFNFDEVRRLAPTIAWLGLETRLLSNRVKEYSTIKGSSIVPLNSPKWEIRSKAHALYRIAYHYNSPRIQTGNSLYQTLKNAQVYETDAITSTLKLSVGGVLHEDEQSRCELHIKEDGPLLEVFVLRDKTSQELCHARRLPLCLFGWLVRNPGRSSNVDEKGRRVTASVLAVSPSVVPMILEDEGIAIGDIGDEDNNGLCNSESEVVGSPGEPPAEESRDVPDTKGKADDSIATLNGNSE
ncbi:hypothetical protein F53441_7607 [Fusarium austroafricanum]|uniref:Protein NO VEIN C-terminal domain-containing protein n=1 Tax=Fusarium austroafricanum TaxID=2364996 RepID=A0A8H4KG77_9HYPO|nr:hypothetical protein F53441_7607 [Fusarium austroafricanum]